MNEFESNQPPQSADAPETCGVCNEAAVETFPGFGGAPDVYICMACGAFKEGEEPWFDPFGGF